MGKFLLAGTLTRDAFQETLRIRGNATMLHMCVPLSNRNVFYSESWPGAPNIHSFIAVACQSLKVCQPQAQNSPAWASQPATPPQAHGAGLISHVSGWWWETAAALLWLMEFKLLKITLWVQRLKISQPIPSYCHVRSIKGTTWIRGRPSLFMHSWRYGWPCAEFKGPERSLSVCFLQVSPAAPHNYTTIFAAISKIWST